MTRSCLHPVWRISNDGARYMAIRWGHRSIRPVSFFRNPHMFVKQEVGVKIN